MLFHIVYIVVIVVLVAYIVYLRYDMEKLSENFSYYLRKACDRIYMLQDKIYDLENNKDIDISNNSNNKRSKRINLNKR